ncbi:hypothetical protein PCC79_01870 [Propioniciclava soli]|uniref:Transcriptional regulator, AbiEi antitoxin, Type IV TA system n=1 Tax=Propioniciclava soli TaxID=2775081 RepID=A0ABZ3C8Z4_9ACTN
MEQFDLRTTAAFLGEGWSSAELAGAVRAEELDKIRRGVYGPRGHRDAAARHALEAAAACVVRHSDSVVSHTSAAVLHGLPVRRAALAEVDLTRWGPEHGKKQAGIRLHRTRVEEDEVVEIGGVRVTSLERTLVDLGRVEPYEWGVVAADAALRRQADPAVLTDYAARGNRVPGNRRLLAVLDFADPLAESPLESMSRVSLARTDLPKPVLQHQVLDATGTWVATGDFGWPQCSLIGEADGKGKYVDDPGRGRTAADVIELEKQRDHLIEGCDWWVIHWGWALACDHVALGARSRRAFRWRGSMVA